MNYNKKIIPPSQIKDINRLLRGFSFFLYYSYILIRERASDKDFKSIRDYDFCSSIIIKNYWRVRSITGEGYLSKKCLKLMLRKSVEEIVGRMAGLK